MFYFLTQMLYNIDCYAKRLLQNSMLQKRFFQLAGYYKAEIQAFKSCRRHFEDCLGI